jgi:hypothetical protein
MRSVTLLLIATALLASALPADEAVRSDGRTERGTLRLEKSGQLFFTPAAARKLISREELSEVRFDNKSPVFRGAPGHLLQLPDGQQIAGVFLGLEKDQLLLRTAWAERLSVPRTAASALTHLPGWRPIVAEDFRGKLSVSTIRGEPVTAEGALVLKKPGESLSCTLPSPIRSGRIGVNFREESALAGAHWAVEAVFALKSSERVVRISLAEEKELMVDPGGLEGTAQRVKRLTGWRRLRIDFNPGSLRITCDDSVLWYTLARGPGGPLRQVRLVCAAPAKPAAVQGGMSFTDFVVERAVPERRRPSGEPDQDELWLADGDQVFGEVLRADRTSVELKGRFGVRRFPWTSLRGWFLKHGRRTPSPLGRGQAVRVWLHSGLRPARDMRDMLEGELTGLDDQHLTLRHPLLGVLAIPRTVLARLRPLAEKR